MEAPSAPRAPRAPAASLPLRLSPTNRANPTNHTFSLVARREPRFKNARDGVRWSRALHYFQCIRLVITYK